MSSTVNLDMTLMAAANIIPQDLMKRVFLSCVEEMHGEVKNDQLFLDGKRFGRLSFGQRIVLQYESDFRWANKREDLRDLFTRRVAVEHRNYLHELAENRKRLQASSLAKEALLAELAEIEKKEAASERAMKRQNKSSCEAIKEELCEAAEMKGYDVVEEKTEKGIQLQFIRREY